MTLDKENHIPLHIQLKHEIEKQIVEGTLMDQIPSEREIMQKYDVSRSTVREAITLLVREGVLVKKHGKGTFVSLKPIQNWLGHLSSTTETIRRLGMEPGIQLIDFYKVPPPNYVKKITGFKEAFYLKRLRLANNMPIGLEQHYYPLSIGEPLADYDLNEITLYDVLEKSLGIQFAEANQKISSCAISEQDGAYLQIEPNTSVLKAERVIKDPTEDIIEYEEAYYRSDLYAFEINLSRKFG
ncbi:GntR family transcriptional regulator [Virgibacillus sp. W0181]|uniref:GntR family transcriptional regulator n=1 Tax=Virgibacillus sp. W0181 TaxID=3391581 RepID=UPI003F44E324